MFNGIDCEMYCNDDWLTIRLGAIGSSAGHNLRSRIWPVAAPVRSFSIRLYHGHFKNVEANQQCQWFFTHQMNIPQFIQFMGQWDFCFCREWTYEPMHSQDFRCKWPCHRFHFCHFRLRWLHQLLFVLFLSLWIQCPLCFCHWWIAFFHHLDICRNCRQSWRMNNHAVITIYDVSSRWC